MAKDPMGGALIVASLMLSIALLGSSYFVSQAVDRGAQRLRQVTAAVADMPRGAGGAAVAEARPGRPDPGKRYDVQVAGSPVKGGDDAKVTIVEFSDFQCPFCSRVTPTLARIDKEYGDDVKIVFKHLPLPMHSKAPAAHAAAEAAHRQGRFWPMHDRIFGAQREMSPERYRAYAEEMGLDMAKYDRDVASADVRGRITADTEQAAELGVTGTPAFFVNGRFLSGAQPFESFKRMIDEEMKKKG